MIITNTGHAGSLRKKLAATGTGRGDRLMVDQHSSSTASMRGDVQGPDKNHVTHSAHQLSEDIRAVTQSTCFEMDCFLQGEREVRGDGNRQKLLIFINYSICGISVGDGLWC